ncbi:MAG: TetR/AcrR family transcriptional regulator [Lentilactobacillus hilgardii]|uniref:TetR/AcrR family transcriptional regulator n=1 Tax=Lentilactobacillus hilgardii TaxID=1588 RepID=UPI0039EC02F5
MKFDLTKKQTLGVQRTLSTFSKVMFELIEKKPFEKINVREICTLCNIPRATFYNYFDDKFDLLKYCWYLISQTSEILHTPQITDETMLISYFDDAYDFFIAHKQEVDNVLVHNSLNSQLGDSFVNYFSNIIQNVVYKSLPNQKGSIPLELIAEQYSTLVFNIFKWVFLEQHPTSKKQVHHYLLSFINFDPNTLK